MSRMDDFRSALRGLPAAEWAGYLAEHSGLPGPRANLELVAAVALECDAGQAHQLAAGPDEYLVMCGAASLGRLAAAARRSHTGAGDPKAVPALYRLARDDRWRVREAVAMGLQYLGDADPDRLCDTVREWASDPDPLVQRAAVAGICEPRLVRDPGMAGTALDVLDVVTRELADRPAAERATDGVRALRKALGYCWSVAVAASPADGFDRLDGWAAASAGAGPTDGDSDTDGDGDGDNDGDLRWIIRENLKKTRLRKADPVRFASLEAAVA